MLHWYEKPLYTISAQMLRSHKRTNSTTSRRMMNSLKTYRRSCEATRFKNVSVKRGVWPWTCCVEWGPTAACWTRPSLPRDLWLHTTPLASPPVSHWFPAGLRLQLNQHKKLKICFFWSFVAKYTRRHFIWFSLIQSSGGSWGFRQQANTDFLFRQGTVAVD